jgi:hypothetical protein
MKRIRKIRKRGGDERRFVDVFDFAQLCSHVVQRHVNVSQTVTQSPLTLLNRWEELRNRGLSPYPNVDCCAFLHLPTSSCPTWPTAPCNRHPCNRPDRTIVCATSDADSPTAAAPPPMSNTYVAHSSVQQTSGTQSGCMTFCSTKLRKASGRASLRRSHSLGRE